MDYIGYTRVLLLCTPQLIGLMRIFACALAQTPENQTTVNRFVVFIYSVIINSTGQISCEILHVVSSRPIFAL